MRPRSLSSRRTFQSTPSVGRATAKAAKNKLNNLFQSTPSVGRATCSSRRDSFRLSYFNPRPPWGGRQTRGRQTPPRSVISIHALRGEGDTLSAVDYVTRIMISIHALRGEGDDWLCSAQDWLMISIHALRGEGDKTNTGLVAYAKAFQSTPSVGRATALRPRSLSSRRTFQSTPSVGRATAKAAKNKLNNLFQSTPSVGRATCSSRRDSFRLSYFNPRPPWGGRLFPPIRYTGEEKFQSTPSVGRATQREEIERRVARGISIHALRGEGDEKPELTSKNNIRFQSTPSVGRAT